ncbi:hypothetical protein TNIN_264891 [Trichonephila inaurata madagascariensis]|uniref:Uncharacterized protein n=1 Tax=Trichonephila inaurata madagascariensis TaxID=2747483 RepID=A0A8X6MKQ8_9ARAC|nr:hypothetical protein TNIN_264891 [Trichonephila inaurata madagascariensis]
MGHSSLARSDGQAFEYFKMFNWARKIIIKLRYATRSAPWYTASCIWKDLSSPMSHRICSAFIVENDEVASHGHGRRLMRFHL